MLDFMTLLEFRQRFAALMDVQLKETPATIDGLWGLIEQALTVTRTDRDRWMGVATSEQAAHAATQAALTNTRKENQRLRAELATLQARAAKAIAATLPTSPDLPPLAEGDVRDGVMSGAEADATARAEEAERKLARARRVVHRLVDLHIDDTGR